MLVNYQKNGFNFLIISLNLMISIPITKINEYKKNGFVKVPNFLDKKKTQSIREDLEVFLKEYRNKLDKRQINLTKNKKINSIHDLSNWEWIAKIQSHSKTKAIAQKIIGEKISNFGAELFYKPEKTGIAVPAHQDNYYWCLNDPNAITIWIALEKANKNNGGIYYFNKSHLLGLLEHVPSNVPGSSQKLKFLEGLQNFKKTYPSLEPGDCLIHHSLIVHGSLSNNSKRSRVGVTLRFKTKNSEIDKVLQQKYERELKKQINRRSS